MAQRTLPAGAGFLLSGAQSKWIKWHGFYESVSTFAWISRKERRKGIVDGTLYREELREMRLRLIPGAICSFWAFFTFPRSPVL